MIHVQDKRTQGNCVKTKIAPILYWTMEGLLKPMFDNLLKLHGSFKMFKSLLLKEDGDGASRTSTGKEFDPSSCHLSPNAQQYDIN